MEDGEPDLGEASRAESSQRGFRAPGLPAVHPGPPARPAAAGAAGAIILPTFLLAAFLLAAFMLATGAVASEPATGPAPAGDQIVSYELKVRLDTDARTIQGAERVTWRNPSADPVAELQLHLYLNAFKNEKTTFMKESEGRSRGHTFKKGRWGYIDVEALRLADGRDLLGGAEFIRPDDGNPGDETVLRVPLPEPVEPGGEVAFDVEFTSKLPQVFARTGYRSDFYLVAQWYPKLGVYEPAGARGRPASGWNCHQFHAQGEFYADFGSFDVSITLPSDHVVGATGKLAAPPKWEPDGTATYRFVQENVHDFAWAADPDFIDETRTFEYARERDPDEERRMARLLGLDASGIPDSSTDDLSGVPEEIRLEDVEVRLLLQPEHRTQADRHFHAAFSALKYYGYWYGRYPYATLTVVDPAYGAGGAGGMEYATLITAGSRYVAPRLKHRPEGVTVHEAGHQFWYGLVANNEFEEAWLDEGINSYAAGKVMDKVYGPDHETMEVAGIDVVHYPLMSLPLDPEEGAPSTPHDRVDRFLALRWTGASNNSLLNAFRDLPFLAYPRAVEMQAAWSRRVRYRKGAKSDEMVRPSWEYYDATTYALNAYDKAVLTLRTLETVIGEEAVAQALRVFHQRYRFKHPSTRDFEAVVNEIAGRDLSWYFDQTLHGSDLLDYEVASLSTKPVKPGAGVFGSGAGRREVTEKEARQADPSGEAKELELKAVVRRLGEVRLPAEIEILFAGGRRETRPWDGEGRFMRIRENVTEEVEAVRIGPAGGRPLDVNWANDARQAAPSRWPAIKWWTRLVSWTQHVLFFYSGIS